MVFQEAKEFEKLLLVFFCDTDPSILDCYLEEPLFNIVDFLVNDINNDFNKTFIRKLDGI